MDLKVLSAGARESKGSSVEEFRVQLGYDSLKIRLTYNWTLYVANLP